MTSYRAEDEAAAGASAAVDDAAAAGAGEAAAGVGATAAAGGVTTAGFGKRQANESVLHLSTLLHALLPLISVARNQVKGLADLMPKLRGQFRAASHRLGRTS